MAHGDAWEGKWKGNWWMEWVASTLHTTLEHGVSSITTADPHTSAASSRLNWRPCQFKQTRPFRWKTKSGFCAYAITFQLASNKPLELGTWMSYGRTPYIQNTYTSNNKKIALLPYKVISFDCNTLFTSSYKLHKSVIKGVKNNASNSSTMFSLMS
jgi:hypothetical protein